MEIKTRQADGKPLTVIIEYPVWDNKTSRLAEKIRAFDLTVSGSSGGKVFQLHISDIYYAESVERKTFLYTKDEVYMTDKKLYELEEMLKEAGIIRISKSCLMNVDMLYSIRQLMNSRLEATLINGERLIVARTYLKGIKNILKGAQDDKGNSEKDFFVCGDNYFGGVFCFVFVGRNEAGNTACV